MISYQKDNLKFNLRISAIIYDRNRNYVLLHKKRNNNFWMLPGGRVEFGEPTDEAIKREMKEELNYDLKYEFQFSSESFFTLNNIKYHELNYYYYSQIEQSINDEYQFNGVEGDFYIFKWVNLKNIDKYNLLPSQIKEQIISPNTKIKKLIYK